MLSYFIHSDSIESWSNFNNFKEKHEKLLCIYTTRTWHVNYDKKYYSFKVTKQNHV